MTQLVEDTSLDRFLRGALAVLAFLVVLALYPFVIDPGVNTKIILYTAGAAVLAAVWVLGRWVKRRPLRRPRLLFGVLAAFLLWLLIASTRSAYPGNSIEELGKFAPLFLLYAIASDVYRTPEQVERLLVAVCGAVGVSVVYGLFQHMGLDFFPWDPELKSVLSEAPGTFGNGNLASHVTVLCVVMAAYLAVRQSRRWYVYAALIILFLLHLNVSSQRGGAVGLCAAALLLGLVVFWHKRVKHPGRAIAAGFAISIAMAVLAVAGAMAVVKFRTGVPYPTGRPILLRYHGYSGASKLILERPLLGFGPGNYRIENPRYWTPFEQEYFAVVGRMNYHVHNDALELGVEGGLPAAGLYLTLLIVAIWSALWMGLTDTGPARRRLGFMFAAFFCTFLVDGLFGFNLRAPVSAMLLFLVAGAFEGVWAEPARTGTPRPKRLVTIAVSVLILLLGASTVWFEGRVFASQLDSQQGRGALAWKAYADAEALFARGETLAPWRWEFAFGRGEAARLRLDAPAAISHYQRALERNPYFPKIDAALAQTEILMAETGMAGKSPTEQLGFLDAAAAYAQRALDLCQPLAEGEDLLGRVASLRANLLDQQPATRGKNAAQWQEAAAHFDRAIRYNVPEKDRAYLMLARARMALGDKVMAHDALVRSAGLNAANPVLWTLYFQYAQAFGQQGVFRDSVLAAVARLEQKSEAIPPALNAAAIAWNRGSSGFEAASALLAEAARSGATPTATGLNDLMWAAAVLVQEVAGASLPPEQAAMPLYNLAMVYTAAGNWEIADQVFTECWKGLPDRQRPDCALLWGQVLAQRGQLEKAAAVFREGTNYSGPNLNLQLALARALGQSGHAAEARIEYGLLLRQLSMSDNERKAIQAEADALAGK